MKTFRIFNVLVGFLIFINAAAQTLSKDFMISNSTPYEVVDAGSKEYVTLEDGNIIMAKMGGGKVTLQKFDVTTMKETSRKEYEDLPKGSVFQDVVYINKRLFYIYEAVNKKTDNHTVFCREINVSDATFGTQKELFSTSRIALNRPGYVKTGELTRLTYSIMPVEYGVTKFIVSTSFDKSKIMFQYRLRQVSKKDAENYDEIGFCVFDNQFNKIWDKEVKMPYTEVEMDNVAYGIHSSGKAFMLVANRRDSRYETFVVDNGVLTTNQIALPSDAFIRKLNMREDATGNIVCAGYYANGLEFKMTYGGASYVYNANGLMHFSLDPNGKLISSNKIEFPMEFIKQNLSDSWKADVEKREKEGKAGILDLVLLDVKTDKEGNSYFVGESQYYRNEMWGGPQTKVVYHFTNVVVMKVDAKGNLVWMKKLPKNQAGISGGGQMSIAYLDGLNADYVAYVDNPKNIKLGVDKLPEAHKDGLGGFLTTYKIDHTTGAIEKHTVCDLSNIKGLKAEQFRVWRIFKGADDKTFFTEVYTKDKKDAIIKFVLN